MHNSLSENFPVEYVSWLALNEVCGDAESLGFGIEMCEAWKSFAVFLSDLGSRPSEHHTLVRINAALGYTPDNCVWYEASCEPLAA
ncbi:MAG: hypothetical protein EOP05_14480 [Proteobacteria bacterium]|nr:MAG: hypothetical protein EOP05_14480 [Pseudomonadota bacterium]